MHHSQVAKRFAGLIEKRNGQIAFDAHLLQQSILREKFLDAFREVGYLLGDHLGTRGVLGVIFEVVAEAGSVPQGKGPHSVLSTLAKLGDKGEADAQGRCQLPHQRQNEVLAKSVRGPCDHESECILDLFAFRNVLLDRNRTGLARYT